MISILDRYVIKSFFMSYVTCLIFIIGLFTVVDFFAKVDDFIALREKANLHGLEIIAIIFKYFLLTIPYVLSKVAPFLTVMAAIFTLTKLCKSNELIPIVMSGTSIYRLLVPIFVTAFLFSGLFIAQQQWLVPTIAREYHNVRNFIKGDELNVLTDLSLIPDGRGNQFSIEKYYLTQKKISGLEMVRMPHGAEEKNVERIISAAEARWKKGDRGEGWYLTDGWEKVFNKDDTIDKKEVRFLEDTDLTPEEIELSYAMEDPESLSFTQLNLLFHRFPSKSHLRILLHSHITDPLSNIILLLLGIPFALRKRNRSLFLGVGICFLIYGAYFGFAFITKDMGNRDNLHPIVAAWLPVVFFGSLGICLLDSIQT